MKLYKVFHGKEVDEGTWIIEESQVARVIAKNEEEARKDVEKKFGTKAFIVSRITDPKEIEEIRNKLGWSKKKIKDVI